MAPRLLHLSLSAAASLYLSPSQRGSRGTLATVLTLGSPESTPLVVCIVVSTETAPYWSALSAMVAATVVFPALCAARLVGATTAVVSSPRIDSPHCCFVCCAWNFADLSPSSMTLAYPTTTAVVGVVVCATMLVSSLAGCTPTTGCSTHCRRTDSIVHTSYSSSHAGVPSNVFPVRVALSSPRIRFLVSHRSLTPYRLRLPSFQRVWCSTTTPLRLLSLHSSHCLLPSPLLQLLLYLLRPRHHCRYLRLCCDSFATTTSSKSVPACLLVSPTCLLANLAAVSTAISIAFHPTRTDLDVSLHHHTSPNHFPHAVVSLLQTMFATFVVAPATASSHLHSVLRASIPSYLVSGCIPWCNRPLVAVRFDASTSSTETANVHQTRVFVSTVYSSTCWPNQLRRCYRQGLFPWAPADVGSASMTAILHLSTLANMLATILAPFVPPYPSTPTLVRGCGLYANPSVLGRSCCSTAVCSPSPTTQRRLGLLYYCPLLAGFPTYCSLQSVGRGGTPPTRSYGCTCTTLCTPKSLG
uniref:Acetyl-coenzyme A synthetase n=1 Tax=Lygus hesperus TaxID=30085 RepID=A0A0A9W8T6_LYGHE